VTLSNLAKYSMTRSTVRSATAELLVVRVRSRCDLVYESWSQKN